MNTLPDTDSLDDMEKIEHPRLLPEGWTEAFPGGMACNPDPIKGGIIDNEIVSGLWFVIFEREDLPILDGFSSRNEAFRAYEQAIS